MGSQESKYVDNEQQKEPPHIEKVPSTPILTPLDPRSPSVNIARTPLEVILGAKTDEATPEVVANKVLLGIDPRSPTVEFTRTPIIVPTLADEEKPSNLRNKALESVRNSTIETPTSRQKSSIVPPKFLGSSPITVVPDSNKRKSFVGLLETNLDFTETDLDNVCKVKNEQDNCQTVESNDQIALEQTESQITGEDKEEVEDENSEKEIVLEETEKTINVTAQVKDFDKKLTNLIYQDDSEDDNQLTMKFSKLKENNRTPLGIRNSNDEPKKASNKLRVSDKPRKLEISKIPVFKDKHGRKIGVQCENTPPTKADEKLLRAKMSQWDAEKSLII